MTDENIIAITAVIVSGVISLATLTASFYTNRANNKAALNQIAFTSWWSKKSRSVFAYHEASNILTVLLRTIL